MTCAMMNCLGPTDGLQLICDTHRAKRQRNCAYLKPENPKAPRQNKVCSLVSHWYVDNCETCRKLTSPARLGCKPCDHCHYCGLVHEAA